MITINDKALNKKYKVKTDLDEITIGEFEKCNEIFSDESITSVTRKYLDILVVLGLDEDAKRRIGSNTLMECVKELIKKQDKEDLKDEYQIGDTTYNLELNDGKLDLTAMQQADIEDIFKDGKKTISKTLKVILDAPLKDIRKMKASEGLPFIYEVEQIMERNINLLSND